MEQFVAYYRVSTARQGASGLGLDAQKRAVKDFLRDRGWPPIQEFTEVESGRKNSRPELNKALIACRLLNAKLVIARLDRLARNASFLLSLRDSGVEFIAVDMPDANRLTVGIMALVAEYEADRVSSRTKAALKEAKRRGKKLGNPGNLSNRKLGTKRSAEIRSLAADMYAQDALNVIRPMLHESGITLAKLAHEMTQRQIPTPRGKRNWTPMQVKRIIDRAKELKSEKGFKKLGFA